MSNPGEIQSNSDEEEPLTEHDYVNVAEKIIYDHNKISIENALILNKELRSNLIDLREKLDRMLSMCQHKYKQNEAILTGSSSQSSKNSVNVYHSYYFCGYPFFKNGNGYAAPPTADYLFRRDKRRELFPLDLDTQKRVLWVARDKIQLIQGVKKQVLQYLQSKNYSKMRRAATKRCANDIIEKCSQENSSLEECHLAGLLKKVEGSDFRINWFAISVENLDERHSTNECIGMWYGYLMPTLNRKEWTTTEEDKLLSIANEYGAQNWSDIAKQMNNRSAYQCFVQHQTVLGNKFILKNVRWTQEEDAKLIELVNNYRIGNIIPWTKIMESMPGRQKAQLYNRYMLSLNPQISRASFTVEEDCILMAAIKEYGTNYRNFPSNLLPGRNMAQIRNRYNNVLKFVGTREHWSEEHDNKLMQLASEYGTSDWAKISEKLIQHNRTSCRQRYNTIKKFLEKNPNSKISDVPRRRKAFSTNVTTENWMETIIREKRGECSSGKHPDEENKQKDAKIVISSALGLDYYEYFKCSFDFQFGKQIIGNDSLFENVQIACQLLLVPSVPFQIDICNRTFSNYVTMSDASRKFKLESDLLKSLIQLGKSYFSFPVNLNTIIGLRGLLVFLKSGKNCDKRNPCVKLREIQKHFGALNMFKTRFMSLFKHTAILTKLTDIVDPYDRPKVSVRTQKKASAKDFYNDETLINVVGDANLSGPASEYEIYEIIDGCDEAMHEGNVNDLYEFETTVESEIAGPSVYSQATTSTASAEKHDSSLEIISYSVIQNSLQSTNDITTSANTFTMMQMEDVAASTDCIVWDSTVNIELDENEKNEFSASSPKRRKRQAT